MQYLAASGAVPRKNLYTPFVGYAYRYYARVIKRLLDEGYLELFRQGRLNHVKITPKGEGVLKDKLEDDVQFLPKNKTGTAKRKRRQSLVADVIGLCEANGMVISAAAKPNLAQLYGSAPEEKKKDFVAQLEKGIFYSSGEIRQAYMQVMGNNEIANWSRLVGIVLLKDNLTFIYSVNQSLIKWMAGSEDRTVRFIIQFLRKSELLQSQIRFFEHPSCIVCGRGMSMIPKIVTGRKWGRVSEDDGSERYKAKIARDHINSHNLAKVFSAAYFVTADRNGVENFRFAALLNEDVKERLCDQWFSSVATATRVKPNSHSKWGWQSFVLEVCKVCVELPQPVVFLLWGGYARAFLAGLQISDSNNKCAIFSSHPSPLGATKGNEAVPAFIGSWPFSKANAFLTRMGATPINWRIS